MNSTTRCIFSTFIFNSRAEAHYAKKAGGESSHMILCFQRGEPQKQRSSAPLRVERWPQGCRPTNPQVFGDSSNGLRGGFFREPDSCSGSWLNAAWQRPVPGLRLRSSEFCHKLQGRAQVTAGGGGLIFTPRREQQLRQTWAQRTGTQTINRNDRRQISGLQIYNI